MYRTKAMLCLLALAIQTTALTTGPLWAQTTKKQKRQATKNKARVESRATNDDPVTASQEAFPEQGSPSKSSQKVTPPQATEPQPLSESANRGLAYVVSQQHSDGGWGQGGGWRRGGNGGRVEGKDVEDPSDVGSTCIATLALIRAGSTPKHGPYAKQIGDAVAFINQRIEQSEAESLYVTDVRDTQLQQKIGQFADTFLAAMVLSELKQQMPDDASEKRLVAALDKTIGKIESNQKQDGTFAGNHGWASILSQGLCSKGLNRAKQAGAKVKDETLNRDFAQAETSLKAKKAHREAAEGAPLLAEARASGGVGGGMGGFAGRVAPDGGDAGVDIYNLSANTSRLQDRLNSDAKSAKKARKVLADPVAPQADKQTADAELKTITANAPLREAATREAVDDILKKLDDKKFIAGFGNKGGEEFLSYMNISETLFAKGGSDWLRWNKAISANLAHVQNKDGSWSGQHCITGRTFCSAAALLTLMADRAPVTDAETIAEAKR